VLGPYSALLHHPELMTRVQAVGEQLRFGRELPARPFELVVLIVARRLNCEFEWSYHAPLARASDVPDDTIRTIGQGSAPTDDEEANLIWELTDQLLAGAPVPDTMYDALVARYGLNATLELVTAVGLYVTLGMVMNVARTAPHDGPDQLPALP
jgi:4-carboxymuconolactone decarboxylase